MPKEILSINALQRLPTDEGVLIRVITGTESLYSH